MLFRSIFNIQKVKANEKDLEFILEKNVSLPNYIIGDERKLKQIMLNLINNAIKFTNEGRITIRVDYSFSDNTFIFEVEDTGIGIPMEKQSAIFEPFVQVIDQKIFTEGTGLGLSITKKLIEIMEGTIQLKSEPDKGSKFRAEIPLRRIDNENQDKEQVENNIIAYLGDRKKILVVDDNQTNVSFLVSLLEPLEFLIEIAENGKKGLQKALSFNPDLILLDYRMPIMNGLEFIQVIKQNPALKGIKIVGVSATVYQKELKKEFHDLCDGFISKPVDITLLLNKLQEILHLEWIYEDLPVFTDLTESKVVTFPDKEIVFAISENAEIGNFNAINDIIENLAKENAALTSFCNIIRKFTRNYDRESIIEICKQKNEIS